MEPGHESGLAAPPEVELPRGDDVRRVAADLAAVLAGVADGDWDVPAAGLAWTCRQTMAHVMDDFVFYALNLSGRTPPQEHYLELKDPPDWEPGAPSSLCWPDPSAGSAGMLSCLDATAGVLAAVVDTAPPGRRGHHPMGLSDASGFAAMGMAEAVLHAADVCGGLGLDYRADDRSCRQILRRIFPHVARTDDPWQDLLTAGGRTEATRGQRWRWFSAVRADYSAPFADDGPGR